MTDLETIITLLPGWSGLDVQRAGDKVQVRGSWPHAVLLNAETGLREHAVTHSKDSLEAAADELRKLESRYGPAKEANDAQSQIPLAPIARLDRDPGRLNSDIHDLPGAGEVGGDSSAAGLGGLGDAEIRAEQEDAAGRERRHEGELHEPAASGPEYVIDDEDSAPELTPVTDVSEPPAQDVPEMEIGDAEETDHGGMLRDDLVNTLSLEIDNIERWRCVAAQNIVDNTDIEQLQSVLASGAALSDEQAAKEREYYRSRNFIRSTREMATDLKVSLKSMTLEKLEKLEPVKEDWPN